MFEDREVPVERPDPEAAKRPSSGAEGRPGFSLGCSDGAGEGESPGSGLSGDPALGAGPTTGGSELTDARDVKG